MAKTKFVICIHYSLRFTEAVVCSVLHNFVYAFQINHFIRISDLSFYKNDFPNFVISFEENSYLQESDDISFEENSYL